MDYIKEITIKEAAFSILDNNSDDIVFSSSNLELDEESYFYLYKHMIKSLKDEELKYSLFNKESDILDLKNKYFNSDISLLDFGKHVSKKLFTIMKQKEDIESNDLLVALIETEYGNFLSILKFDYVKNYVHNIEFEQENMKLSVSPKYNSLPSVTQKLSYCAFIKEETNEYDVLVINKNKEDDYFLSNFLDCYVIENDRDKTKKLYKAVDKFTKKNLKDEVEESKKVRNALVKKLKEDEEIDIREVSKELFKEDIQADFSSFIKQEGVDEKIKIDKEWTEKKLKRVRLKVDKDIDVYLDENSYDNKERFEVKRQGDGYISILIKGVKNYEEK
ncbi:MAG: nucleoid-associated protein [Clostridiaceae bacterium]